MKSALTLFLTLLLLGLRLTWAQETTSDDYLRSPRLGINHISGVEEVTSAERYQKALELGAGWNRWPLYWDRVETEAGTFDWSDYDRLVTDDLAQGLQINAILLGRPEFYASGERIMGLNEPIYADGSDTPAPDKELNPKNPWVSFVQAAVNRYRPGGELALERDWPDEQGVRIWEIWNEPDYEPFWSAGIHDYARLLKTAYLVIKSIDPDLQVMFGGLLYSNDDNWLAWVLAIFEDDPFREDHNWYMDMIAVHNYSYPWRSGWLVNVVDQTLIAYKLKRPIWLNESGVPVWDDYPGPLWAKTPEEKMLRATREQQAYYFIQSAAYAFAEGAQAVFFHQLYDDCGNQPGGTDFEYHTTPACPAEICSGDAFGLFRNESTAVCFSHHPQPGSARPAARAYQLVAELFGQGELEKPRIELIQNHVTLITFDRPAEKQRLYVVWNATLDTVTLRLPVGEDAVTRYALDETGSLTPDNKGLVEIELPGATCDNFPFLQAIDVTGIGGTPYILVGALPETEPQESPVLLDPIVTPRTRCAKVDN